MNDSLLVSLLDTPVGVLTPTTRGRTQFSFLESYREMVGRPVLGQWFEDNLVGPRVHRKRSLLPWFENMLAEGDLRKLLCKEHHIDESDDVRLLSALGRDLPGAVIIRSAQEEVDFDPEGFVENDPVVVREFADSRLKFSLAGVQLKLSMSRHEDRWTLPVHGVDGDWIAKIAWNDRYPGVASNEYTTMQWARRAGFDVPHCELSTLEHLDGVPSRRPASTPVFLIQRYDRTIGSRVHQEDFAQVFGITPSQKYDHVTIERFGLLVRDLLGESGLLEWLDRLLLTIATGNTDAHLKNWSLLYPDRIQPVWAPLYDQLCTLVYEVDDELALKFGGTDRFTDLDRSRFRWLAQKLDAEESLLCRMDATLERLREAWRNASSDLPISEAHREALRSQWSRVPILRDAGELP